MVSAGHRLLRRLCPPHDFWELWTGRVLACLFVSALVAAVLGEVQPILKRFVDATVQTSLLSALPDAAADGCGPSGCLQVVEIDDEDFREVFGQRSPLDPEVLRQFVAELRTAPPRVLAIDLDLAPADAAEWPARRRLLAELEQLAATTRVLLVCPKGFDTGNPGTLDREWVEVAGRTLRFVSAAMSRDGLYYDPHRPLASLGVAAWQAATADPAATPPAVRASDCARALEPSGSTESARLIRPTLVDVTSFTQAMGAARDYRDRIVFLGGRWGTSDLFWLRGAPDPVPGVRLHAWVTASQERPPFTPAAGFMVWADIGIGLLFGALFAALWHAIVRHRERFAIRAPLYVVFLGIATVLPLVYVDVAMSLAELGFVLGVAGMMISSAVDVFVSAHEKVLDGPGHDGPAVDWSGPGLWLGGAIAFAAGSILLHRVDAAWAWAVTGVLLGTLAGAVDARTVARRAADHGAAAHDEGTQDLAVRLGWLGLRCAVLASVAHHEFDATAWWLVTGFFASAALARIAVGARLRRPPAGRLGVSARGS